MSNSEDFKLIRPQYEVFREKISLLIGELLRQSNIEVFSIESRTKSIESFEDKINRPDKKYTNPLNEVTDLCGIRIITYYTEEIYQIAEIMRSEFTIDNVNSIDKTKSSTPDKFGYQSLHFILNLNDNRNNLMEWKNFKQFKFEVQIRTILQHSWAAIDHKLRYKSKDEIPSILKRKIYRLSALLELADEQFLTLKNETTSLHAEIENSIDNGNLEIEINTLSIHSYFQNNKLIDEILKIADSLNYVKDEGSDGNEYIEFFYPRLLEILKLSNLHNINDLDIFLRSVKGHQKQQLKNFIDQFNKEIETGFYSIVPDLITILLVMNKRVNIFDLKVQEIVDYEPMVEALKMVST